MTEIIINTPSKAALVQLATALGYYDATAKQITVQATIDAGGDYFFNLCGQVIAAPAVYDANRNLVTPAVMAPGLWARLRHNADPARLDAKIAQSRTQAQTLGITIYYRAPIGVNNAMVWTSDGVTRAPPYVDSTGVIA